MVLLVEVELEAGAVKPSEVPFLAIVSDTVAASSSGAADLAAAFTLILEVATSAVPVLPVQLF